MDSIEGTATLEWWANRSTCLGRLRVGVGVCAGDDGACEASFEPAPAGDDRESFDFLLQLDPLFTLRFDDGSVQLVNVEVGVEGRLILTAAAVADTAEPTGSRRMPPL
ncbi:hypothetical protein ABZ434_35505 [Streptomyces sp. NPDC005761]|uniref:hypothetical protein n=1 Tax=unclassified Streptomyces TaxID=2593676 RepID=UPI0033CE7D81